MRLTLRTLLAWLDSLLPPGDQQALAEKVAASPVAPTLVRRIQQVVENAGVGTPRLDARGLADDANSVAEYLDNCLEAERLADFERICIESDIHLAEVASCHGVLAEMSRDPSVIEPLDVAMRKRFLDAVREHVAAHPDGEAAGTPGKDAVRAPSGRRVAAGQRRAPIVAWVSAAVAVALLVGLTTFFVRSILAPKPERRVAVNRQDAAPPQPAATPPAVIPARDPPPPVEASATPPPAVMPAGDNTPTVASSEPVPAPATEPQPRPEPRGEPAAGSAPPSDARGTAPEAGGGVPDAGNAPPAAAGPAPNGNQPVNAEQPRVAPGGALAIAAVPAVTEPPPRRVEQPPAAAPAEAESSVTGVGLLLHRPPVPAGAKPVHGASGWAVLPVGSGLAAREELLATPACRPEIRVRGVTMRFEPQSQATLTTDADGTPRLELVFGRVAVRAAAEGAKLGLTVGGLSGVVMSGLQNPVGIELLLDRDPGDAPGETRARATIVTTTGGIRWRQTAHDGEAVERPIEGLLPDGLLEAGRRIVWDSRDPDKAATLPGRDADWIVAPARIDRLESAAADVIQARLAGGQPFEKTLRDVAADRREREENRAMAAATLALVGDYDALAMLLCSDPGPTGLRSGRWRKVEESTVPLALARGANAAARLAKAFEQHAPAGRGQDLVALARGVGDAELAAGADARLVEMLDAAEPVIRRYAFRNLDAITLPSAPGRPRYDPDWSAELRRDAVEAWQRHREQGRIRRAAAPPP